jgi:hypothetical protein
MSKQYIGDPGKESDEAAYPFLHCSHRLRKGTLCEHDVSLLVRSNLKSSPLFDEQFFLFLLSFNRSTVSGLLKVKFYGLW